jgi:hypothetical protein
MRPDLLELAMHHHRFADTASSHDRLTPPPAPHAREARELVDSWLATSFIGKGDAVEDLIARIAWRLARPGGSGSPVPETRGARLCEPSRPREARAKADM